MITHNFWCPPGVWVISGLTVQSTLSIVPPFWHNANFEKVEIIDRGDYRQSKFLMFYYKSGTERGVRKCDYRQSFHMWGL